MSDKETQEMENPDSWDFEKAEVHPPAKPSRIVVSVAFSRSAFEQVTKCAESMGVRVSEFIREAAVEKASRRAEGIALTSVSGPFTGAITFNGRISPGPPNITRVRGSSGIQQRTTSARNSKGPQEFFLEPVTS